MAALLAALGHFSAARYDPSMPEEKAPEPLDYASPGTATLPGGSYRGCLISLGVAAAVLFGLIWWDVERELRFDIFIVIENASPTPISRVEFYFDERKFAIDNIVAGSTTRRQIRLRGSGQLNYAFPLKSEYPPGVAAAYLDGDCKGYRVTLHIDAAGATTR